MNGWVSRATLAAYLACALLATAAFTACGGNDDGGDAAGTTPTAATTPDDGAAADGRELFASQTNPPCSSCHTLADAGADGTIGPNLDQLQPSVEQVRSALQTGPGLMPVYGSLSEEQIRTLSEYVAQAAAP